MSSPLTRQTMDTKYKIGVSNSDMAPRMELSWAQGKPTVRTEDTDETNVLKLLCARHDIHNTPWQ